MEKLSKKALGCMYVATGIGSAVLLVASAIANLLWLVPEGIRIGQLITGILGAVILLNAIISPYFRYHRYRYMINEEYIDIREGYLMVERNIVPLERIHNMKTLRGPIDRMFGVAKVIVTTAGGDVTLRFVENEKADQIAERLGKRINQIVVEQRDEDGE